MPHGLPGANYNAQIAHATVVVIDPFFICQGPEKKRNLPRQTHHKESDSDRTLFTARRFFSPFKLAWFSLTMNSNGQYQLDCRHVYLRTKKCYFWTTVPKILQPAIM